MEAQGISTSLTTRPVFVHDGRPTSFLNALVAARGLRRAAAAIPEQYVSPATRDTGTFWRHGWQELLEFTDRPVYLCLTSDDRSRENCLTVLTELSRAAASLTILTQRWPDMYETLRVDLEDIAEILVAPFDVLKKWPPGHDERDLLNIALVHSGQIPHERLVPDELRFSRVVAAKIRAAVAVGDSGQLWSQLSGDGLADTVRELRSQPDDGFAPMAAEASGAGWRRWVVPREAEQYAEQYLQAQLVDEDNSTVAVGRLSHPDHEKFFVVRPFHEHLPSVRWLVENHNFGDADLIDRWSGPEHVQSVSLRGTRVELAEVLQLVLETFAEKSATRREGAYTPPTAVMSALHTAATNALHGLDLLDRYTVASAAQLSFDAGAAQVLVETGTRSGKLRLTLVLKLIVGTPAAAAFLFANEGYNLMKLERSLEGVLIGMHAQSPLYLASLSIPSRLRIDTAFNDGVASGLPAALARDEVEFFELSEAIDHGLVTPMSSMKKVLDQHAAEVSGLVVFRQSETIGPSTHYATVAGVLAGMLAETHPGPLNCLDLFSGSGLPAREMLRSNGGTRVHCVDAWISAVQARLQSHERVTWLRMQASEALRGERGVLHRPFDLVTMDPPHGALFDLLFAAQEDGRTALDAIKRHTGSEWLVVYQGHVSQTGRGRVIAAALRGLSYPRVRLWQLASEVITIAGPDQWPSQEGQSATFDELMRALKLVLDPICARYQWPLIEDVEKVGSYSSRVYSH